MMGGPTYAPSWMAGLSGAWLDTEVTDRHGSVGFEDGLRRMAAWVVAHGKKPNKIMFIGNGGSAGVASHQATDYTRTGGFPALAFNDGARLTCVGNDFGYEEVFRHPIRALANAGDLLVAISSSGQSQNVILAAGAAREIGCAVVTMSAFKSDNPLRSCGDLNFWVPTDRYGFAEIGHLALCHTVLDGLMTKELS